MLGSIYAISNEGITENGLLTRKKWSKKSKRNSNFCSTINNRHKQGEVMGQVLFIFFSVVVGLTLYSLWSLGYFARVTFTACTVEPMVLVYRKNVGSTQRMGDLIEDLSFDLLDKDSIDTFRNFGIYYDKPNSLSFRKCRYIVGCLLEKDDFRHLDTLKERYNVVELPSQECLTASYPLRGPLSISVAVLRVYPKIKKILQRKSLKETPVVEIYDDEGGTIQYFTGTDLELPRFDAL